MELMWDGADEEIREAYGREHLEEQRNGLYKAPENCALSLEPVLCALEDAIVSENPAIRYLVDGGRGLLDWHNVSVKKIAFFLKRNGHKKKWNYSFTKSKKKTKKLVHYTMFSLKVHQYFSKSRLKNFFQSVSLLTF